MWNKLKINLIVADFEGSFRVGLKFAITAAWRAAA
jgi:hypothetical protein